MSNPILQFWQDSTGDPYDPLFAAAPILMHSIDADGKIVKVSTFWASKLRYSPEEMIGRRSTEFLTEASREYAISIALPEFYRTGRINSVEYDFVRKDGVIIPVLMSCIAQYAPDGSFARSLAIMFDNSEAKMARAALQKKQRLEAIGRLVDGVAQDFNNLLTVIQGNLEFLADNPDSPNRQKFLNDALAATGRGASLTKQLLAYGGRALLSPSKVDLNAVISELDTMLRRLAPERLEIETITSDGLWECNLDRAQLETALMNIIINAQDAMPSGGELSIEACNVRISHEHAEQRADDLRPGRYVMVAISDTGEGMSQETVTNMFEPFYSTKRVGEGAGLGLSMAYGFVRQSGGDIRVHSIPGAGTTFKLYFPSEGPDPDTDTRTGGEVSEIPTADILVVEDEEPVRRVLVSQLEAAGFRVTEAATGDIAVSMITQGYRPKVLVTDVVMPGAVQGPELARIARKADPLLRVVFVSGFPDEATLHGNKPNPSDVQLIKPFERSVLVNAVQRLMDGK